jgi:hypothetical protein
VIGSTGPLVLMGVVVGEIVGEPPR